VGRNRRVAQGRIFVGGINEKGETMNKNVLLLGLALAPALYAQQPTVASVVNAGSYAVAGLPNAPVAQGSLVTLFGTNIGPATLQGAASFPLPTTLAGTSTSITVNGTTTQGIMIYTLAGQVAAVLPSKTPVGTGTLTVTYNGKTSPPLPIQVVQSSFGAFTLNQNGSGAAVVLDGNGQAITPLNPATPNQTVAIWGTGLGPITGDETRPPAQMDMANIPVEVYVGTMKANISYRGRTGYAGVDQINFQIPPGQLGCSVPVAIKIDNVVSNFTTLAVSNSGPCSDPTGIPASAMQTLAAKGSLNSGGFALLQTTLPAGIVPGTAGAVTEETDSVAFLHQSLASINQGGAFPSLGGCSVQTLSSDHPYIPDTPPGLDAGPSITLSGPNGTRTLSKVATTQGTYSGTLSPPTGPIYITPGTYTFTGTGGADVGALTAMSTVGPRVTWMNKDSISTVNRSQDLTVMWSGGPAGGYALITGGSTQVSGTTRYEGLFYCLAPLASGQFTIPSVVLLALPVTSVVKNGTSSQPMGGLAVGSLTTTFVPPPPGIDLASASYMESTQIAATYQ
jgi:uncharacterized protein (TIGR03437 family)